ncbi:hypothetical protein [Nocardia sp. NPDC004604]|uniref:hypothetical protein n=1 Tax=Nocardia sp. NPDC004604 TaxID=3157013 RepID=UPI0033AD652C
MKIIRAALAACAITASMFGAITPPADAAPTLVNGPCLFGHVDPHNDNSACRGSDSAKWPESEGTPAGTPKLSCSRLNDGQHVKVRQPDGSWGYFLCRKHTDLMGPDYWDWDEILGM